MTWKVQVDRAGDYEVALNHAAEPGAVGQQLQVNSGNSTVRYTLAMTKGVFGNKSYEMTPINGLLHLEAGAQSIAISIPDAPKTMAVLTFRSLELIPVAAKAAIEADRQEAIKARASTEWMTKAGYGLMFHWTSQSVGKDGTHKPYAQAVDDFDVKRFADMVEETGAGYVFLTIGHAAGVGTKNCKEAGDKKAGAKAAKAIAALQRPNGQMHARSPAVDNPGVPAS